MILIILIILLILIMRIILNIPYGNHYRAGIWPDGPFRRMGTDGPMGPMTMARWEPDGLEVPSLIHRKLFQPRGLKSVGAVYM